MPRLPTVLALTGALALLGCSGSADPKDSAALDTAETDTSTDSLSCGIEGPCGGFSIDNDNPDAFTCMWTLLAEDIPQANESVGTVDPGGDSPRRTAFVTGFGDRSASVQSYGYINGCGSYADPPRHCDLAPAEFFIGCLKSSGKNEGCIDIGRWTTGCATETTCPE